MLSLKKAQPLSMSKGGLTRVSDLIPEVIPSELFHEVIRPEDIGYTHPIFLQCFMPVRHNVKNAQQWQTDCGRASLVIRSGILMKPGTRNTFKNCTVPAGSKARILNAYISDYAKRHRTPVIPLGETLREAMRKMAVPIGGKNGKELQREVENLAASEIILGVWDDNGDTHQEQAKLARRLSFWIDKDENQRTLWQPEMTLSSEYYEALTDDDRMAPFYWPAMIKLQHSPRAMDIHSFLVYRLRNGLKRPVPLSKGVIHAMFGHDTKDVRKFWADFKTALALAHAEYPTARIEVLKDDSGIILKDSPPLIPYRKMPRLSGI